MALDRNQINNALAVLEDSVNRCMTDDACAKKVLAILEQLAADATVKWPFDQFRSFHWGKRKAGMKKKPGGRCSMHR